MSCVIGESTYEAEDRERRAARGRHVRSHGRGEQIAKSRLAIDTRRME
jgi:hypothetical protein